MEKENKLYELENELKNENTKEKIQITELEKLGFEMTERSNEESKKILTDVMKVFSEHHVGYREVDYFLGLIRELMELSFRL